MKYLIVGLLLLSCGTKPGFSPHILSNEKSATRDQPGSDNATPESNPAALPAPANPAPMPMPETPVVTVPAPSLPTPTTQVPNTPLPPKAYNPCPSDKTSVCLIMPFGESTTTGVGTTESGGYRVPLIRKLWAANQKFTFVGPLKNGPAKVDGKDFPVNHAGFSGHTIENSSRTGISEKAIDLMKTYKPHVVTLMIGGNDVDIKNNLDDAPNRLAKLMDKILTTNPDTLLIVAKMVPATNDDFNVLAKAYYEGIDRVAKVRIDGGKHVVVVDMPTPMMSKPDWKKALYFDRLHPNDAGCAVEADVWYEALKNIFR